MEKSPLVHSGHWQRTRDRILSIPKTELTEIDVLEGILQLVLTRADTNEIARHLLYKFHNIVFISKASEQDFEKIEGIGKISAQKLAVLFKSVDFIEMASHDVAYRSPVNVASAVDLVRGRFDFGPKEKLQAFYLDENNVVLGQPIITEGELDKVGMDYQSILNFAQRYKAIKVIIAHNHPSNNIMPSKEDFVCTSKLYTMLRAAGYRLVDHIIITKEKHFSFYNTRIIPLLGEQYEQLIAKSCKLSRAQCEA